MSANLKRDFTSDEVCRVVDALGGGPPHLSGGALVFRTVCHNPPGTGSHKLFYYPDGWFHCFTQCGDSFDLYTLVCRARGCAFPQAVDFVASVLGLPVQGRQGFSPPANDDFSFFDKVSSLAPKRPETPFVYTPVPSTLLSFYPPCAPVEWLNEGITAQSCRKYQIRCDPSLSEVIIPHFDAGGRLIGVRSRILDPVRAREGGKYMPTRLEGEDFRHSLKHNLYGLNMALPAIRRAGRIILFEAEKSVLQCDSFYGGESCAVAVCGSSISLAQRDLALKSGAREVILAFDKEFQSFPSKQSDDYADKILKLASLFTPYVSTCVLWDKRGLLRRQDSPSDRGRAVFEALLHEKNEVTVL